MAVPGTVVDHWHFFWVAPAVATIEAARRAMWCFFRMENEQLNNCGNFRPVAQVPPLLRDKDCVFR